MEKLFPLTFKEYNSVIKCIGTQLLELMKNHNKQILPQPTVSLTINSINIKRIYSHIIVLFTFKTGILRNNILNAKNRSLKIVFDTVKSFLPSAGL